MSEPGSYSYSAGFWIQPLQLWKIARLEAVLNNEVNFTFLFFGVFQKKSPKGYQTLVIFVLLSWFPNPASSARRGVALILSPCNKLGDFWGLRLKYCTIKGTMPISHFQHFFFFWFWIEHWISAEKAVCFQKMSERKLDGNLRNQKSSVAI